MNISELEGAELDAAVAEAEGFLEALMPGYLESGAFSPSTSWEYGGPIIERERIATLYLSEQWYAVVQMNDSAADGTGPTPLIAAMRAFVASKTKEGPAAP